MKNAIQCLSLILMAITLPLSAFAILGGSIGPAPVYPSDCENSELIEDLDRLSGVWYSIGTYGNPNVIPRDFFPCRITLDKAQLLKDQPERLQSISELLKKHEIERIHIKAYTYVRLLHLHNQILLGPAIESAFEKAESMALGVCDDLGGKYLYNHYFKKTVNVEGGAPYDDKNYVDRGSYAPDSRGIINIVCKFN